MADIDTIFSFEKFLYAYAIFLFFIVLMISMGASTYLADITGVSGLTAPVMAPPETSGNAIVDVLSGILATGSYVIQNLLFFFTLATINSSLAWLGYLIFSPAIIMLVWGIIKMLRG